MYQGVRVIEDNYDEGSGVYKEKVVFKHGEGESFRSAGGGGSASAKAGGAGGRSDDPFGGGGGGAYSNREFDIPELDLPEEKSIFSFFKSKKKKK